MVVMAVVVAMVDLLTMPAVVAVLVVPAVQVNVERREEMEEREDPM